jgi:DNA-binding MarR family transcriptional regulator
MNLKPNAYKIVMYLFGIIEMGNILVNFSQKKIADDLGLQPSNVSRAFKELFKKVLIKDSEDGHVYLNSNLCTMGVPKTLIKRE